MNIYSETSDDVVSDLFHAV